MANENLKNMLALSKKIEEKASKPSSHTSVRPRIMTEQQLNTQIGIWDEEVFGKPKPPANGEYTADAEMERIKNRQNESTGKTLNNPILQEVFNNPYEMDIDIMSGLADPARKEFDEKLQEKYQGGLAGAIKINETIEKKDREKLEQKQSVNTNGINYEKLQEMIENVIDKKLGEIKTTVLNESISANRSNKISMIMLEDTFKFVDSEGNVYQSNGLKRVGKLKVKK